MGRFATISERGAVETVLSYRLGALVARELRARGWAISGAVCRGLTPRQIAKKVMLGTARGNEAEDRLAIEIAEMCGYVPPVEGEA